MVARPLVPLEQLGYIGDASITGRWAQRAATEGPIRREDRGCRWRAV